MSFKVYIPARYQSSRLPGKLLLEVSGKSVLAFVVENAKNSGAEDVVVATDDERIAEVAESLEANAIFTSASHTSGTDRIAEAVRLNNEHDEQIIVNVQADEPLLPASVIAQVAQILQKNSHAQMATVCESFADLRELTDPNICKVVRDTNNRALYFSRAPIPFCRDIDEDRSESSLQEVCRRHIGLYAYRVEFLQKFIELPHSALEHLEKLEQLRVLTAGFELIVEDAQADCGLGVDTQADFIRFSERVNKQ